MGYEGNGVSFLLRLCVEPNGYPQLESAVVGPLQRATQVWVDKESTIGNVVTSGGDVPSGMSDVESVLLHEIGHALGLAHPNLGVDGCPEEDPGCFESEFTMSLEGSDGQFSFDAGIDGVPGSRDDDRQDDVNLHWFNIFFNNPFILNVPVDYFRYDVDVDLLPGGHAAVRNGSRDVYEILEGDQGTEAVMQQGQPRGEAQRNLVADDVATLLLAASGVDRIAGTGDDYEIALEVMTDLNQCDIPIKFVEDRCVPFAATFFDTVEIDHNSFAVSAAEIHLDAGTSWYFGNSTSTAPPTVNTANASNITQGSAQLNMTANPGGDETFAWFVWEANDSTPDLNQTPFVSVGDSTNNESFSYTISGLTCETTYYFQARASNSLGSDSGDISSFTTDDCTSGGGDEEELIVNGGFEDGNFGWVRNFSFFIGDSNCPFSGDWYAYLTADQAGNPGDNLIGELYQLISIPENATSVELTYRYSISTSDPSNQPEDVLSTFIYDSSGSTVLDFVDAVSNVDAQNGCGSAFYDQITFDLTHRAGELVQIYFLGTTDNRIGTPTVFRLDDVKVTATLPDGAPPEVFTIIPSGVTDSRAELNGQVNPNGLDTVAWFDFEANDSTPNDMTEMIDIGAGTNIESFSVTVTDLECDTQYYFEANASNDAGDDDGIVRSFTTDPCVGEAPTVDTDPASAITETSAQLNADINPNGASTTAWFQWGTSPSLGNQTSSQAMGSGTSLVDLDASLSGLDCGTVYYFRAVGENAFGLVEGVTQAFQTVGCALPGAFTLTHTGTGCNIEMEAQIEIEWTPSADVDQYEVYRNGILEETTGATSDRIVAEQAQSHTLVVRAVNSSGGTNSNAIEVAVPSFLCVPRPDVITELPSEITRTSARFNGSIDPRGIETTAFFEWGFSSAYGFTTPPEDIGGGTDYVPVTFVLDVECGTTYWHRTMGQSVGGTEEGFPPRVFTTPECPLFSDGFESGDASAWSAQTP